MKESPKNFPKNKNNSDAGKEAEWLTEHKQFVDSGRFDAIPVKPIMVGDMVATRGDNLIYEVYQVNATEAIIGYDPQGKKSIRKTVPLDDIRDGEGYQNALLGQRGLGHVLEIKVKGRKSKIQYKGTDN